MSYQKLPRNQYKRVRSILDTPLYRNAYALIFNTLSTSGLGFLYWLVAARFYDTDVVGLNAAFIAAMQLIAGLAGLNLNNLIIRFASDAGQNLKKFLLGSYLLAMVITLLASITFLYIQYRFIEDSPYVGQNAMLLGWFIISTIAWSVFSIQDAVLVALREAHIVPVENLIFGIAKILLLILFVSLIPTFGLYASWTIPVLISLFPINYLIFFVLLPKYMDEVSNEKDDFLNLRTLSSFMGADYVGRLFSTAGVFLLPIIVTTYISPDANAYFTIAWLVTFTLPLLTSGMSQSLTVESSLHLDRLADYTWRIIKQLFYIVFPLATGLFIFAPVILSLFGEEYVTSSKELFRLLTIGAFIHSLNNIALSVARVNKKISFIFLLEASWSTVVIILGIFLIGYIGLLGIGVAYIVGQIITFSLISATIFFRLFRSNGSFVTQ